MAKLITAIALLFTVNNAADVTAEPGPEPSPIEARQSHEAEWRAFLTHRRGIQKARLQAYIDHAEFPWNDDQPGLVNIFVDDAGVRCAMANLVHQDGHRKLVKGIAAGDNDYTFGEGVDGELEQWLLTSGLTLEEAVFVQVPDMRIDPGWPDVVDLREMEIQRIQMHLSLALMQLENTEQANLDLAIDRLGDRVFEAPPSAG